MTGGLVLSVLGFGTWVNVFEALRLPELKAYYGNYVSISAEQIAAAAQLAWESVAVYALAASLAWLVVSMAGEHRRLARLGLFLGAAPGFGLGLLYALFKGLFIKGIG